MSKLTLRSKKRKTKMEKNGKHKRMGGEKTENRNARDENKKKSETKFDDILELT